MGYPQISLEDANVWFAASNLAAIVGAVLVLVGAIGVFRFGAIRDRYADERISKNEADTAQANAQAEVSRAEAAKANLLLEQERLARVKIEERMAPRSLNAKQATELVDHLKPLAGTHLNMFCTAEPEPIGIANVIIGALNSAGCVTTTMSGTEAGRAVSGVLIEVMPGADAKATSGASALAKALTDAGLFTTGPIAFIGTASMGTGSVDPTAKIRIVVGRK